MATITIRSTALTGVLVLVLTEAKVLGMTRSKDQAKMFLLRTKSSDRNITIIVPAKPMLKRATSAVLCVQNIESPDDSGIVGNGLALEPINQRPAIALMNAGPSPK